MTRFEEIPRVHLISRGVFMEVPIYYDEEEEWQRALLLYDAV